MLSSQSLQAFREQLLQERERILAQLEVETAVPELGRNPDRTDLAVSYGERERLLALSAMEQKYLQQIEFALLRLDEGTYGSCSDCGEMIAYGRLEIMPHAAFCVDCQRKHEQQSV